MHVEGAPTVPDGFFERVAETSTPVLGVCYGMQLLVQRLGGVVEAAVGKGEFGRMPVVYQSDDSLLYGKGSKAGDSEQVWMSHGDEATKLPSGFVCVGKSEAGAVVAIEDADRKLFGLQYHPEVTHSEKGTEMLRRFLFDIAGVKAEWSMQNVLDEQIAIVNEKVGKDAHVICALSGGVDSAVAATLVHKAIGDRLHCVFVDNGLLRYKEQERVMEMFKDHLHLPVDCVDHSEQMLKALAGVSDPEKKRKIIGAEFIECFKNFKSEIEKRTGVRPTFLVQGTLYPDVIESCPPREVIKSTRTRSSRTTTSAVCPRSSVSSSSSRFACCSRTRFESSGRSWTSRARSWRVIRSQVRVSAFASSETSPRITRWTFCAEPTRFISTQSESLVYTTRSGKRSPTSCPFARSGCRATSARIRS